MDYPPDTRYVAVGDADVAYQVVGDGPLDLLYFAGLGSHVDVLWDYPPSAAFFGRLASFARLILFDRRGAGASDAVPHSNISTWETGTEDALAVLDAVGSEQAAIFGEVEAGPTAILLAATQPERVRSVVLANTTARYLVDDDYPIGLTPEFIDTMVQGIEQTWGTAEAVRVVHRDADPELVRWSVKLLRASATPRTAAAQYRYIFTTMDVRRFLGLVQAPTLVLHTKNQAMLPISHSRYLASEISGAQLVELPADETYFTHGGYARIIDETAGFLTGQQPQVEIDRVLAAVLFTDIVGSTGLAASMGDKKWAALLDAHDRIVRDELRRYRGREINTTGDGFFASFDGPARAIRCARAIVESARRMGLQVRSGLHVGECQVRVNDLGGLAVHVAARIGAEAEAGDVLVSSTVKDLVDGSEIRFAPRGERELRGLPGSWQLYAAQA